MLTVAVLGAGEGDAMRTQNVTYAVHEYKFTQSFMSGCGYSDFARFIFHVGGIAFLFGKHKGRTLVVEFLTFGSLLNFRLMQTVVPSKPDLPVYGYYKGEPITVGDGWKIIPEGEEIPQEHMEYSVVEHGMWCESRRCHSTMTPLTARLWGSVRAYAGRVEKGIRPSQPWPRS
jgi:hypothetical protein